MTLGNAPMEDSGLMEDSASTLHASLSAYASLSCLSLSCAQPNAAASSASHAQE